MISTVTPVYPWLTAVTGRQFHKYMNPSRIPWLELTPLCQGWKLFIKVVFPVADPGDLCCVPVGLSHVKSMTCNSSLHRQVRQVDALQPCSQMWEMSRGISCSGGGCRCVACPGLSSKLYVLHTCHRSLYLDLRWPWWNCNNNSNNENNYQWEGPLYFRVITSSSELILIACVPNSVLRT